MINKEIAFKCVEIMKEWNDGYKPWYNKEWEEEDGPEEFCQEFTAFTDDIFLDFLNSDQARRKYLLKRARLVVIWKRDREVKSNDNFRRNI